MILNFVFAVLLPDLSGALREATVLSSHLKIQSLPPNTARAPDFLKPTFILGEGGGVSPELRLYKYYNSSNTTYQRQLELAQ